MTLFFRYEDFRQAAPGFSADKSKHEVVVLVLLCTFLLILGLTKLLCHVKIDPKGGKNEFQLFVEIIGITIDCEAS